jgi:hypothetical protein
VVTISGSAIDTRMFLIFFSPPLRSPDGSHLLAQTDDHHVDVFQLKMHEDKYELIKVYSLRAPTTLLAIEWYPFARYDDAVSWCFVMSARDIPTRLIDAYQGVVSAPVIHGNWSLSRT